PLRGRLPLVRSRAGARSGVAERSSAALRIRWALALGVLGALAGFVAPVLLAFDDAGVAGDEAGFLERGAQLGVGLQERAGDAVTDGDRLSGHAAPVHVHVDPVLPLRRGHLERLMDDHARGLPPEVGVEGAVIHDDLPVARLQANPGNRA